MRISSQIVFVFLLMLASVAAYSQPWPSEIWHDGNVVLENGDTLKGKIKYDLKQDLIQYNLPNQRTEALSSRKVLSFEIFDETEKRYRLFFALPYAGGQTQYRTPVFFELLAEGKLTLLTREALEFKTYSSPYYLGSYSREVLVYHYFFLDSDGEITEFKGSKADLLNMMGKQSSEVEKYMKANRLKIDDRNDFARIVIYYNSI